MYRWESCKGSVWESVKKCSRLCSEARTRVWISRVACGLQAARRCTQVKHAEKLNRHASCSTTGQKVQTGHSVSSRLGLTTQKSRKAKSLVHNVMEKLTLCIPFSLRYKYPLYPQNIESFQREFWERNLREKQDWLIHNDFSNSSTLTLSIVTSLRDSLTKSFSHLTHICERAFWCFGKQFGRNQFILVDAMGYSGIW